MSDDVSIRLLDTAAGPALLELDRACPIDADFVFRFDREPDFFLWPRMIFDRFHYAGVFAGETLVGCCLMGLRTGWTGDGWGPLFYVGDARVLPRARGRKLSQQMAYWFAEQAAPEAGLGFFIVKEGNAPAATLAGTTHPRGYQIHRVCRFEVVNLPLIAALPRARTGRVRRALPADLPAIAALAQRTSCGKLLAPWTDEASLRRDWLVPEAGRTFALLAERAGRLRGAALFRDLGPARRTLVLSYPAGARLLRLVHAAAASVTGARALPRPGEAFRSLTTTLLAVDDEEPEVARDLLSAGIRLGVEHGYHLLHVGFAERDPLRAATRHMLAQRFRSELFLVSQAQPGSGLPLGGVPRVDLAML